MRVEIIADASSNHMGDMRIAGAMIEAAAEAGVDTVKFQSWRAEKLRDGFPDFRATYERHSKAQLSHDDHLFLIEKCKSCGVDFLTTCFDIDAVDFLASFGLKRIKVASPDCASFAMLKRLMGKFESIIISTGMSTDEEIKDMVKLVKGHDVTVLHCVSIYPTPPDKVNLARMDWLRSLGVKVGFSDHSLGPDASIAAMTLGAEIIEKHYTLSRCLPGKDQQMSAPPEEFAELARWAKLIGVMKGVENPGLSPDEMKLRDIYIGKWGSNR